MIVEDANKKEVDGKKDIVAKAIQQNSKKFDNSLQIKKANLNKISTKENSSKVIKSSTQDSDEWESF